MTIAEAEALVGTFEAGRVMDADDMEAVRIIASNRYSLERSLQTISRASGDAAGGPVGEQVAGKYRSGSGA